MKFKSIMSLLIEAYPARRVQNMDQSSGHEPPPWTQAMDQVQGPTIFPTPKSTIENNKGSKISKLKKINSQYILDYNGN